MTKNQAISVLIQASRLAHSKGIFSLEESSIIHAATKILTEELKKDKEDPKEEEKKDEEDENKSRIVY
jgi:hypothetical protein